MFNIVLALVAGVFIGWNFHSFFQALNPPTILSTDINISSLDNKQALKVKNIEIKNEENISKTQKIEKFLKRIDNNQTDEKAIPVTFYTLLNNGLYSDALALYKNENKEKKMLYRVTLESYFQDKIMMHSNEAIIQLEEYIEIEPQNIKSEEQLIQAYIQIKEYDKAIHLLIKRIENTSSAEEQEKLSQKITHTSQSYIDELTKNKNFQQLVAFLKEHIEYGFNVPFFTFTLAKHYVKSQEYLLAVKLLKEIEFNDEFGERAKKLLEQIKDKKINQEEYQYKLPLIKEGEHFLINVNIDETPLKLLLDTGASYTLIDENKLSSLTLIDDEITLETPAGNISSRLQQAQSFKIAELELSEFKLVTSPFNQAHADGLLGMNFFKQFKFKIDQEKGVLYLGEK